MPKETTKKTYESLQRIKEREEILSAILQKTERDFDEEKAQELFGESTGKLEKHLKDVDAKSLDIESLKPVIADMIISFVKSIEQDSSFRDEGERVFALKKMLGNKKGRRRPEADIERALKKIAAIRKERLFMPNEEFNIRLGLDIFGFISSLKLDLIELGGHLK